jgi:hypothetical protein
MDKEHKKTIQSKDSTAIGNICLNVTKEEFERQKNIFMKETPELGGLKIKSVSGLFYDNRLAAVQIISQQQDFHKKGGIAINGWYMMYYEKYGKQHKSNKYRFDFEKVKLFTLISVLAECARCSRIWPQKSDYLWNSFKQEYLLLR